MPVAAPTAMHVSAADLGGLGLMAVPAVAAAAASVVTRTVAQAKGAAATAEDDTLVMEPYIETALCTSCDECTNLNNRMFAYDANKQAVIKDPRAGTYLQLVRAAELCPVNIIHPGTPLNPKEKGLEKWIERARKFN